MQYILTNNNYRFMYDLSHIEIDFENKLINNKYPFIINNDLLVVSQQNYISIIKEIENGIFGA